MESLYANSVTRSLVTRFVSFFFLVFILSGSHPWLSAEAAEPAQELFKGFEAKPDSSVDSFQSLLTDPTRNFSFGFLRVNRTLLSLAVIHANSSDPLWVADPTRLATWSEKTRLYFNGSLVISDPLSRVVWSTGTDGDRVVLRNDSNLQVEKRGSSPTVEWQSFDFPTNTLVENQNFTSAMTLFSSNGLYSMRLGDDFIGLYVKFDEDSHQIYWKHKALEAKAQIEEGSGPIYARVNPNGYLGMYQRGNIPVDVEAFNSFQRPVNGLLIVRLESDGNLRGYYWDGSNWALNYQAIAQTCDLPDPCGPYGLCTPGSGCSCLDNRTELRSGECNHAPPGPADFCGGAAVRREEEFRVLRRRGVEVPFKELMDHETASSWEQCQGMCSNNCSCWGAVYNNGSGSGFCYLVNHPIRTMLGVGDESKVGYFKVRESVEKKKSETGLTVGISLLSGAVVILTVMMGYVGYRIWTRERGVTRMLGDEVGLSPGPYKDLGSASFRSIEMSRR